jgi:hypothetical protein
VGGGLFQGVLEGFHALGWNKEAGPLWEGPGAGSARLERQFSARTVLCPGPGMWVTRRRPTEITIHHGDFICRLTDGCPT